MKDEKARKVAAHRSESIDHSAFRCNAQEERTLNQQNTCRRRRIRTSTARPALNSPAESPNDSSRAPIRRESVPSASAARTIFFARTDTIAERPPPMHVPRHSKKMRCIKNCAHPFSVHLDDPAQKDTIAAHFGLTFLQCRIPPAHAKHNALIINDISIQSGSLDQEKSCAPRAEFCRTGLFFDTPDPDFMQPAPFLRLTDIAAVMNNQWRNRKPFFSTRSRNRVEQRFSDLRNAKTQP
ncbi:hypothetical protein [Burkholderia sp. F1]|uniref:hypothetical protein n=1 Tax=Burkholderia sp. F1 TaxID=3366817 RepID=UPI003D74A0F2